MNKVMLFVTMVIMITSCNKNEDFGVDESQKGNGVFSFTYSGEKYSSTYELTDDSLLIFHNKEVDALYKKLFTNPDLAVYQTAEGEVELYDSFDILAKIKGLNSIEMQNDQSKLRSSGARASIMCYEHKDYTGQSLNLDKGINFCGEKLEWRNRISSMKVSYNFSGTSYKKFVATIFTDCGAGGYSRSIEVTPQYPNNNIRDFCDIHYQVNILRWINWDNEVACITTWESIE